jgi:hypothetical protein
MAASLGLDDELTLSQAWQLYSEQETLGQIMAKEPSGSGAAAEAWQEPSGCVHLATGHKVSGKMGSGSAMSSLLPAHATPKIAKAKMMHKALVATRDFSKAFVCVFCLLTSFNFVGLQAIMVAF